MEKLTPTEKVKLLKRHITVMAVAELIGISKATLYTRIEKSNWKKSEKLLIKQIKIKNYV